MSMIFKILNFYLKSYEIEMKMAELWQFLISQTLKFFVLSQLAQRQIQEILT